MGVAAAEEDESLHREPPSTVGRDVLDRNCEAGDSEVGCVCIAEEIHTMRTNIVIDDKLMEDTLRAGTQAT